MPRITSQTIRRARTIDALLPLLLPVCRDIRSAQLELRWLREHAARQTAHVPKATQLFHKYIERRSKGEPLQYIIGNEYFGDLEMRCRPGVLIPRQETAASISHLVHLLSKGTERPKHFHVLDMCTGTGCIPLLFHHEFFSRDTNQERTLDLLGVDISPRVLALAQENLEIQRSAGRWSHGAPRRSLKSMKFIKADVLQGVDSGEGVPSTILQAMKQQANMKGTSIADILISNPPYISSIDYLRTTSRSVRNFEPKLALVPRSTSYAQTSNDGDIFYPRLLDIAQEVEAKVVLFEVADLAQAQRVTEIALERRSWETIETWRDCPADASVVEEVDLPHGQQMRVLGSGNGRSVLLYRGEGRAWLGR